MKAVDAETIDRIREAEGSENKIKVDTDTTNQWLKIDAQEVLSKIHGFERTLNNHKRHTTIPTWAKSINSRLEVADAKLAKLPATPALNRDLNKTSHHLNDDQYKKISNDFDTSFNETRSVFDTQTIDLKANVERLQQQLNVRPTSTELSKVNILLNDVKNQIQNSMVGLQVNSYRLVEDKVAADVENVSKKMDLSEHKREQGIESTMKKSERYHQLIATVKEDVDVKILSAEGEHKEILKKYETYAPRYIEVEEALKNNFNECTKNFEKTRHDQAVALQNFTEYKGYTNVTLEKLQKLSAQIDEKLKAVNVKLLEKDAFQTERFNALSERVDEFIRLYEFDTIKVKDDVNNLKIAALERQQSTLTDHNDFLSLLKNRDIINVITTHEEQIASIFKSMEDFELRLATQNDIIKTTEGIIAIISDEMESFPEMVTQQTLRLIKLHQLLDKSTNAMAEMRGSFETVINHVSELYAMSSDVADIKDAGARSSDKVDEVQAKLDSIKAKTDEHDTVIQKIRELLGEIENDADGTLVEIKDEMKNAIVDKFGEVTEETDKVLLQIEVQNSKLAEHNVQLLSSSISKSHSLDPNSILDGGDSDIDSRSLPATGQHAEMVAKMCMSFESLGARTNTVPNIPDAICEQLLYIAEQLTKFAASSTDLEAVEALISEDNLKVNAESLAEKSKARVDKFVDQCRMLVDTKNPPNKVNQIRNDCRDKYFNLFIGALYSWLSSHDQVITVGNSRFGRTKIPTRETPKKPSREILYSSQGLQRTSSRKASKGDAKNAVHNVPNTKDGYDESMSHSNLRDDSSIQTWSKLNLPSVPIKPDNLSLSMSKSEENLRYVLKSGFKMPLKNKAGSIASGASRVFDDDSVQESRDNASVSTGIRSIVDES